jgi:hypothetical protein
MRECQCATSPHKWDAEAQALPAGFQLCDLRAHLAHVAIQKHSRFPNRRALKNAVRQAGNVRQRPRFAAIVMPTYLRLLAHVAFTVVARPAGTAAHFRPLGGPGPRTGGRGRTGATRGPIRRPLRWDKTYWGATRSAHVAAIHAVAAKTPANTCAVGLRARLTPLEAPRADVSVSTLFDGASHSLFDVLFGAGGDRFPDATEDAVVLTAVKDATRRWCGGPKARI